MCALCGLLGGSRHWSEERPSGTQRRRERLLQVARANRVLGIFKLKVTDFEGQAYILAGPTGATELVNDLGELWRVAERMSGRPIDPLTLPLPPP
jgi:hypothetical protein